MLSETNQTKKDRYHMISYVESRTVRPIKMENRVVIARVYGLGEMARHWSRGTKFQLEDGQVLEI